MSFTPHYPDFYVCGVYIHRHDIWVGEFMATSEELIGFTDYDDFGDAELQLIETMVETKLVYKDWWERTLYYKN